MGICCSLVLTTVVISLLSAQPESRFGNWTGVTSSQRYTDDWRTFVQGEIRTWEFMSNLNELLWRVAVLYDFNPKYSVAAGYVRVDTWPYNDEPYAKFHENRFYQEFSIRANWWGLKVDHRFRLEQRWITTVRYGTEYANRIRYKLGLTYAIKNKMKQVGKFYIKVLIEIFWDFDRFDYWFDREAGNSGLNQNRLYGGVGYKISGLSSIQLGYLWQHRPKADFHRLVLGYSYNFDFRRRVID